MGFCPPKGVRPPQLEGKRTGRPKGSKNHAKVWAEVLWGYEHRDDYDATPPTQMAGVWRALAHCIPDELKLWLRYCGQL